LAEDKDVLAKVKSFKNMPPQKPEPAKEPKAPESPVLAAFGEITKLLTTVNNKVQQRGHGFDDSQKETIKQYLSLIFGNLGEE
jgi:hypothetical protein